MKTYFYTDDSYSFSNGCSCCDDTFIECYNSEDTDYMLGSAHSIEDCWVNAILTELRVMSLEPAEREEYWQYSLDTLKTLAYSLGIDVEIEFQEDVE